MKFSVVLILAATTAAWAADPVVPMNIKTGQWEMTITRDIAGGSQAARPIPKIPPERLAQLPPEQRARVEAMLAQAAAGGPRTGTTKTCIKKEDLAQMQAEESKDRPNCKNTVLTSSSTKQVVKSECEIAGMKRLTTATFEALSQDSVKFTIVSNPETSASAPSNPAAAATVTISGTSKWLGPVCTEAK